MNDHNLDDLIITNTVNPTNNKKTKSFLTIIALFIIVLIVGIILSRILSDNQEEKALVLEENTVVEVAPELKLQAMDEENNDSHPKEEQSPIITTKTPIKAPTVETIVEKEEMPQKKQIVKEKPLVPTVKENTKPNPTNKQTTNNKPASILKHYIQVGSFAKDPSTRFLSVIKNSGFSYKIIKSNQNSSTKLLIGPYTNRASADTALIKVRSRITKSAFVVKK